MKNIIFITFIIFINFINNFSQPKNNATLEPTFIIKTIDGIAVPFQNNFPDNDFPVPSFEKQNRDMLNLAGTWKKLRFIPDHDKSLNKRDKSTISKLSNDPYPGIINSNFDDSNWEDKVLPSVENRMNYYNGLPEIQLDNSGDRWAGGVWYRRHFTITSDLSSDKLYKLIYYSVNYVCDVWLNGVYLGYHEGGYTPFSFDLSGKLNFEGENILAVRVDAPPMFSLETGQQMPTRYDMIPSSGNLDWFNYGGIIHDVYIEISEPVSVIRTDVVPLDNYGNINVKMVGFNNRQISQTTQVTFEIFNTFLNLINIRSEKPSEIMGELLISYEPIKLNFSPHSTKALTVNYSLPGAQLWKINDPKLYILKVSLRNEYGELEDEYYTQFGFRTISTFDKFTLLNNQPTFLTGAARHEDHPEYGRSLPLDAIYNDLDIIKNNLYCTFLRTGHYPNHPYTYIIADRLGLSIMEEIPLWWFEANEWSHQSVRKIHKQMFREMVFKDYNRPSILFWSTCNENFEQTHRGAFIQEIKSDVNNYYDDNRIVIQSAASHNNYCYDDWTQDDCDITAWTMWTPGNSYQCQMNLNEFLDSISIRFPNKPTINTEYGASPDNIQNFLNFWNTLNARSPFQPDGNFNCSGFLSAISFWLSFDFVSTSSAWNEDPLGHVQTNGLFQMNRNTERNITELLRQRYSPYWSMGGIFNKGIPCDNNDKNILEKVEYRLFQNYPNPFNPITTISYNIPKSSLVILKIHDILGREVFSSNEFKNSGYYQVKFDGTNLSSGIYFYKLKAGDFVQLKKMILIK